LKVKIREPFSAGAKFFVSGEEVDFPEAFAHQIVATGAAAYLDGDKSPRPQLRANTLMQYLAGPLGDIRREPKVLHMVQCFGQGGAQRVALSIAEAIPRCGLASTYSPAEIGFKARIKQHGIKYHQVDYSAPAICALMRRESYNLLHIHFCNCIDDNLFDQDAVSNSGFPVILTCHIKDRVSRVGKRSVLVCVGKTQQAAQTHPSLLIENGFDLSPYCSTRTPSGPAKRIGFASRLDGKLQPDAVSILINCAPSADTELVVIGDGYYRKIFESQAKDRPVTFEGVRWDMPKALADLDIFVYPTAEDVLPTVVIEAMASGLPVVAPPVGDIPSMLADGRGYCVPVSDMPAVVRRLSAYPQLRTMIGAKARQYACRRWDRAPMAAAYDTLYRRLLDLESIRRIDPMISIIIPTFGRPKLAKRAAEAALAQDIPVEVIVVNDGDLASDYSAVKALPVKYIQLRRNSGPATARNAGLAEATGELIGLCDDDDMWDPGFARALRDTLMDHPECAVAYGGGWIDSSSERIPIPVIPFNFAELRRQNFIFNPSTMSRRSALVAVGGWDEEMDKHGMLGPEDWELWLRLATEGYQFIDCQYSGLHYRGHGTDRLTPRGQESYAGLAGRDYIAAKLGLRLGAQ
jgi:glycosyltransferase involved in cell wall biosynthesis